MRWPILPRASRTAVLAGFAVAAGLLAAGSFALHVRERERALEAQAQIPMVERIVAARDLAAGTRLVSDHLAVRRFPAQWVTSDALPATRHGELEGSVLSAPLKAGEAVLPVHVVRPQGAFSALLAPGRRAITLPVDQVNSLSGLLQPGDFIDLYVSFDHQRKRLTAPLLQGMLILATGHETSSTDQAARGYSTVTLDAAPEDVVKLVAARQAGTLTAILRHPGDIQADRRAMRGDLAVLLGIPTPLPPARKRAVILYGAAGARAPALRTDGTAGSVRLPSGWFDLPGAASNAPEGSVFELPDSVMASAAAAAQEDTP